MPLIHPHRLTYCLEGELVDLIDEFSDGRIQFAFAKVKDPNTTLPKFVLIGWVRITVDLWSVRGLMSRT